MHDVVTFRLQNSVKLYLQKSCYSFAEMVILPLFGFRRFAANVIRFAEFSETL